LVLDTEFLFTRQTLSGYFSVNWNEGYITSIVVVVVVDGITVVIRGISEYYTVQSTTSQHNGSVNTVWACD
jgi:hypothetical protein